MNFRFETSYLHLPRLFYVPTLPSPVTNPQLLIYNQDLAVSLGLGKQAPSPADLAILAGNAIVEGSQPLAQAYAGHQYGHQTMLGDGRAVLLGEHLDLHGKRYDIQLKGSGRNAFSRSGDGRAALGPMLREYLLSEAMTALHIPSTRSLAVVKTGEAVYREHTLKGAILVRVADSHIRFGTFELAAAKGDLQDLQTLADYCINRHYPHLAGQTQAYRLFFEAVMQAHASLIARWTQVGFVHGVMNTDNMTISGQTIDYGPCAFIDSYDPAACFSSIDRHGRYSFGNQAHVAQWNLARLAESLLPLFDEDQDSALAYAQAAVEGFPKLYADYYQQFMLAKLGFAQHSEAAESLLNQLLTWMQSTRADYTLTFSKLTHALTQALSHPLTQDDAGQVFDLDNQPPEQWFKRWMQELGTTRTQACDLMHKSNPIYIARNHLVEEALSQASEADDITLFEKFLKIVQNPYTRQDDSQYYELPLEDHDRGYQTFCGT